MTESRNRDLATSIGAAVASDNIATDGTLAISGVVTYTNLADLPSSGVSAGDLGFVTANNGLYIRGSSGWYVIALVNTSPSYTTSPSASYNLATDGTTTTAITIVATDPEGFAITYSATADSGFNGLATVSQSSNVFTVTPKAQGVATTESGTLTFRATDGVNNTDVISTFTLVFTSIITDNGNTVLLTKGTGAKQNQTFTDSTSTAATATVNGSSLVAPLNTTISPHRSQGYSWSFDGASNQYVYMLSPDSNINFGTGDFTIECWFFIRSMPSSNNTLFELNSAPYSDSIIINVRNSYGIAAYLNTGSVSGALTGHDTRTMGSISSIASTDWTHLAIVRNSDTITLYLNGVAFDSGSYSGQDFTNQTEVIIGGGNNGTTNSLIYDLRIVKGTAVYTSTFTPPVSQLEDITGTALLACRAGWFKDISSVGYDLVAKSAPEISFETPPQVDFVKYDAATHGGSVYFDGTTSRSLSFANTTDYNLNGSGVEWCVEFWAYNENWSTGPEQDLIEKYGNSASAGWTIYSYGQNRLDLYPAAIQNTPTTSPLVADTGLLNKVWHHFVFTRNSSNNFAVFINGQRIRYTANYNSIGSDGGTLDIGGRNGTGGRPIQVGYMSDIRIVKGSTPYDPTQTTLTVPSAPLTDITNTKFLLGIDNQAGVFDNVQNSTLELAGNATSSTTQTKNASSSIYFDGSGDNVKIDSVDGLGTDDFTIEWWAYQTASPSYAMVFAQGYSNTGIGSHMRSNGDITVTRPGQAVDHAFASGINTINTWYHVALTRGAGTLRCYVNGVETGSGANTTDYQAGALYLGVDGNGSSSRYTGYIEDFRITKGLVRYPFVPAKETLTADSNTFLLCMHADAATTVGGSNWTVGNGGVGPAVSDFAPGPNMKSYYFGDALNQKMTFDHTGTSSDYEMGDASVGATHNFSIEMWFWVDEDDFTSNAMTFFSTYNDAANNQSFRLLFRTAGDLRIARRIASGGNDTLTSTMGIQTRTWHHLYYVEESSGNTMYWAAYIDGKRFDDGSTTSGKYDFQEITVGARADSQSFHGYLSNIRIQKGTVAFPNTGQNTLATFTPPTAELEG